jgi:hypothetical protein
MPYKNEHSARLHSPAFVYSKFRRQNNKFGKGIHAIWGIGKGVVELQAIRFDSKLFTAEKAKLWLKRKGYATKLIKFEPAIRTNPLQVGKHQVTWDEEKKRWVVLKEKRNPVHTKPSVRWWIGLTEDFRNWDIFGTHLDPHHHKMFKNYMWFMGPYASKQEAEIVKKTEGLKNPPKTMIPQEGDIVLFGKKKVMMIERRGSRFIFQDEYGGKHTLTFLQMMKTGFKIIDKG